MVTWNCFNENVIDKDHRDEFLELLLFSRATLDFVERKFRSETRRSLTMWRCSVFCFVEENFVSEGGFLDLCDVFPFCK